MQCYQLPIACAELIIGSSKPGGKIEMQFNFVRVPCKLSGEAGGGCVYHLATSSTGTSDCV